MIVPTLKELQNRQQVLNAVIEQVRADAPIKLPRLGSTSCFQGSVQGFSYQFEGEEDLLHLIVSRTDGGRLTAEEGQAVATFVFGDVPPGLVWLRPAEFTHHVYLAQDELLNLNVDFTIS